MHLSPTTRQLWFDLGRHDDPTGTTADPSTDPAAGGKATDPGDGGKTPTFTGDFDPDRAARALAAAREGERAAKVAAQQAAEQARVSNDQLTKVLAALGKAPDGSDAPADPEAIAAELTAAAQQAREDAWRAGTTLAVYRAAASPDIGADAEALLDSNQFFGLLDDLIEDDPNSPEFADAVKARVQEAVEKWPGRFKAGAASGGTAPTGPSGPRPDPSQGRGGTTQTVDFRKASPEAVAAEMAKYRLRPYAR